jgi:hypothetical protein
MALDEIHSFLGCEREILFEQAQQIDEGRLTVIRCAIDAWRVPQDIELMHKHRIPHEDGHAAAVIRLGHLQRNFVGIFQHHWTLLPPEESLAVVREIVSSELDRPDLGTAARYPDVYITSVASISCSRSFTSFPI